MYVYFGVFVCLNHVSREHICLNQQKTRAVTALPKETVVPAYVNFTAVLAFTTVLHNK